MFFDRSLYASLPFHEIKENPLTDLSFQTRHGKRTPTQHLTKQTNNPILTNADPLPNRPLTNNRLRKNSRLLHPPPKAQRDRRLRLRHSPHLPALAAHGLPG